MALVKIDRLNLGLPYENCNRLDCRARSNLLKCGACKIALYCGQDHQHQDRPRHKTPCKILKEAREALVKQQNTLAEQPDSPLDDPECIGHFWSVPGTRSFMQTRFGVTQTLLAVRTGEAVDPALDLALKILRLCRGDNQGIQTYVPAMYVGLGRDQEAYDFIKCTAPYPNLHLEDIMSDEYENWDFDFQLSFAVILTLIFAKVLLDVGLLLQIVGDILLNRPDLVDVDDYLPLQEKLGEMVGKSYAKVKAINKYSWPAILRPERYAAAPLGIYGKGTESQAVLAFRESWDRG
ncbi:hypothetical protein OQA88_10949 [Cercophora sp. LCS_1]